MKVLVIEDDPSILEAVSVCFRLRWIGVEMATTSNGEEGIRLAESESPDVIILDIGLPDISGFEVLEQIRLFSDVPVIILTVRGEEMDKVRGLELGADDYITKPFNHMELLARVRTVLKRASRSGFAESQSRFVNGELMVDFETRTVSSNGEVVKLTPTEYKILYLLVRNVDRVVTHRKLMYEIWGEDYVENTDRLRTYIRRLRDKLKDEPPRFLLTEHGLGYKLLSLV